MTSTYTALVKQDGDWWIGWIEEVPGVNAQERTKEELMASLREILREAREGGSHSWWGNPAKSRRSAVLRHNEVNDILGRKICKDLDIPRP